MDQSLQNKIVSFIWLIADDCLRNVYVQGKYRDVDFTDVCIAAARLLTRGN